MFFIRIQIMTFSAFFLSMITGLDHKPLKLRCRSWLPQWPAISLNMRGMKWMQSIVTVEEIFHEMQPPPSDKLQFCENTQTITQKYTCWDSNLEPSFFWVQVLIFTPAHRSLRTFIQFLFLSCLDFFVFKKTYFYTQMFLFFFFILHIKYFKRSSMCL